MIVEKFPWVVKRKGDIRDVYLSAPVFWLDASDTNTMFTTTDMTTQVKNDADAIGRWNDKSGNGYDFGQATAGLKPAFKLNIQNGKPGALFLGSRFDAVSQTYMTSIVSPPGTTPTTRIYVIKRKNDSLYKTLDGGDNGSFEMRLDTANKLDSLKNSVTDYGSSTNAYPLTTCIATATADGTNVFYYLNGAANGSVSQLGGNVTGNITTLGDYQSPDGNLDYADYMFEVLYWNRVLPANEFNRIHAYLIRKWGI